MSKVFIKVVEIGIKQRFPHWNSTNVGILGIAIADLLMDRLSYELDSVKFDNKDVDDLLKKLVKLSFLFLSRRLEVSSSNANEIYMKRSYLLQNYGAALYGKQNDSKDEIISDHYNSSLALTEKKFIADAEEQMELAKLLYRKYNHEQKEITSEDLREVVETGMIKYNKLYNKLLAEYQENKLSIKTSEFEEYFLNNKDLVTA